MSLSISCSVAMEFMNAGSYLPNLKPQGLAVETAMVIIR